MAENGTPLDALETGEVANTADASRMANILRDMNASGADVVSADAAGGALCVSTGSTTAGAGATAGTAAA
jgi:hypothetical protein